MKANVAPNAAGAFSTTIAAATMAKLVGQSCVLRAVPANHASASAHFAGVRLLVGDVRLIALKNGSVIDYRVRAPQLTGRGIVLVRRQLRRAGLGDVLGGLHHVGGRLHLRRPSRQHDRRALGASRSTA